MQTRETADRSTEKARANEAIYDGEANVNLPFGTKGRCTIS